VPTAPQLPRGRGRLGPGVVVAHGAAPRGDLRRRGPGVVATVGNVLSCLGSG
jgi:hypothetical protein